MQPKEILVVGGGLVGAAIAYGAAKAGAAVTLLDQGDVAHRASRGNFGLVWVHSKGDGFPRYADWCKNAVELWPTLARELFETTGVDVALQQPGGFWIGFSDKEMEARSSMLARINNAGANVPYEMLNHSELKSYLPHIGPEVAGGSYCPLEGQVNPLKLLHAFHAALKFHRARVISNADVVKVNHNKAKGTFEVVSRDGQRWITPRVVLGAGLNNTELAAQVGLHAPVQPNRGQVLITERMKPFLAYPTNKARQTQEGTVQLGFSVEDVGLDDGTTVSAIEWIADRAIKTFPIISSARLVRAWGALRVMTPDGTPIYQESSSCPGAFVATSHSGVSLAAGHAFKLGPWMAGYDHAPLGFEKFAGERFRQANENLKNAH
jgi:glycine/D-amino acid oxidase-like deaminating enzyme